MSKFALLGIENLASTYLQEADHLCTWRDKQIFLLSCKEACTALQGRYNSQAAPANRTLIMWGRGNDT